MRTIKIKVHDRVYKHFMWFLERFRKDEIQIIDEDEKFQSVQEYLSNELEDLEAGRAEFISLDELDAELERTIRRHED